MRECPGGESIYVAMAELDAARKESAERGFIKVGARKKFAPDARRLHDKLDRLAAEVADLRRQVAQV